MFRKIVASMGVLLNLACLVQLIYHPVFTMEPVAVLSVSPLVLLLTNTLIVLFLAIIAE